MCSLLCLEQRRVSRATWRKVSTNFRVQILDAFCLAPHRQKSLMPVFPLRLFVSSAGSAVLAPRSEASAAHSHAAWHSTSPAEFSKRLRGDQRGVPTDHVCGLVIRPTRQISTCQFLRQDEASSRVISCTPRDDVASTSEASETCCISLSI